MKKSKLSNNQLLVLPTQIYLRKENIPGELVEHIGKQVREYLTKLLKDFQKAPGNDNDSCIQKVEANILLVEKYYNGQN